MSGPPPLPDDLGAVSDATPLGGGSICDVWHARLADGREVVVKATPYDPAVEADGLAALQDAGAPVPAVLGVDGGRDGGVLVLAAVGGPPDWAALGTALAALHRTTSADGRFGWHADNLIGRLPQHNGWTDEWPAFYAEQRLVPLLDAPALDTDLRRRIGRAIDGPLGDLLPSRPPASLVHGDLWSGNVVAGRWLIDPAVCHVDRELELAFADLFGGLPAAFWDAYAVAWPLDDGWRGRRPALQLYHLLVHVAHFGGGYNPPVAARLDELGW